MNYIAPASLRPNDLVAVVAPARVVNQKSVEEALEILQQWGLRVRTGDCLFNRHQMFAGADEDRCRDLQWALDDPEIKAVLCARGGYGTTRILDSIDWQGFKENPKWICGFSDVTALLAHVHCLGIQSIHSTMPQLFDPKVHESDLNSLKAILYHEEGMPLQAEYQQENQQGRARGILIGGNLSLLVHIIGTSSELDTENKILCIEEIDEYLYQVDRMMIQLQRAGKLRNLAGVAVGHLTKMKEGELTFDKGAAGVIRSHLDPHIPVAFGLPFGHDKPNLAIPFGREGSLEITSEGSELNF
ncbi:MAG: LD-carboxypeptidase [Cyclobacteriaceae bacterium]|nr:LD-carboxypeptidase [Cyclobacteriaceae bacterium]